VQLLLSVQINVAKLAGGHRWEASKAAAPHLERWQCDIGLVCLSWRCVALGVRFMQERLLRERLLREPRLPLALVVECPIVGW
jgi:hypothetical protein